MISHQSDEGKPGNQRPYPHEPWIESIKADVDRTLLRQNLRLTPTERLHKLQSMLKFVQSCRQAKRLERTNR